MALLCNNIETNYQDNSREVFVLEKLPNNEYRSSIKCFNAGVSDRTPFINIGIDRILVRQFYLQKISHPSKKWAIRNGKITIWFMWTGALQWGVWAKCNLSLMFIFYTVTMLNFKNLISCGGNIHRTTIKLNCYIFTTLQWKPGRVFKTAWNWTIIFCVNRFYRMY